MCVFYFFGRPWESHLLIHFFAFTTLIYLLNINLILEQVKKPRRTDECWCYNLRSLSSCSRLTSFLRSRSLFSYVLIIPHLFVLTPIFKVFLSFNLFFALLVPFFDLRHISYFFIRHWLRCTYNSIYFTIDFFVW